MPTAEPAGGGPEGGRSPDRGGQKTVCLFKSQGSCSVSTAPGTSEMNACPSRGTKTRPEPLQTTVLASGVKLLLNDTDLLIQQSARAEVSSHEQSSVSRKNEEDIYNT